EVATFGGPDGRFFAADGLLYSSSQAGLEFWDPISGSRLGSLAGLRPAHHDLARGEPGPVCLELRRLGSALTTLS
ncbi:hypothetical protein ACFXJJ_12140, partial [Streptomyces sp. NPDC059233]